MERALSELESIWALKELEREEVLDVAQETANGVVEEVDAFLTTTRKQKVRKDWMYILWSALSCVCGHRLRCTFLKWWSTLVC